MSSRLEERTIRQRNNKELLTAAKEGNVENIHNLIHQGADVNFKDSEGNTPLHYAVKKGNFEAVELLLREVKDPNIENNQNETPFDIACRFPQENIIEALEEQILEDSLNLLEEDIVGDGTLYDFHQAETLYGFLNTSEARRALEKSWSQTETELEREISNDEIKMRFCLEYLTKLTEVNNDAQDLSFNHANALICFIETFALHSPDSQKVRGKKEIYFSRYYSKEDRELIRSSQKVLLGIRAADRKIGLEDVRKFIVGDMNAFFSNLRDYVKNIYDELSSNCYMKQLLCFEDKLETINTLEERSLLKPFLKKELEKLGIAACGYDTSVKTGNTNKEINVNLFLQKLESRPHGVIYILMNKIKTYLKTEIQELKMHDMHKSERFRGNHEKKQFSAFLKRINTESEIPGESIGDIRTYLKTELTEMINASLNGSQQDIPRKIFEFWANFYPAFVKETGIHSKIFSDFRYKLMYQFQKYQDAEFEKKIYLFRTVLFKSCLAKEVHALLKSIKPDESVQIINESIKEKIEFFKDEFDHYSLTNQVEHNELNNFSLCIFSTSMCSDEAIENLVDQYLKFMILVDCEKKEYQKSNLDDAQRREVFENFKRLKKFWNNDAELYKKANQTFKEVLQDAYWVLGVHFDAVCLAYIENKDEFSEADKNKAKQIAQTVKNVKKIKDKYELPSQVIISLYDKFSTKETFSSTEILSATSIIDTKIQCEIRQEIHSDNMISITVGDHTFAMKSNEVVSNILKIFYYDYQECYAEFTVEELFNDEVFLKFATKELANEEFLNPGDLTETADNSVDLIRKHRISTILKKLLYIEYAAPYIVNLIAAEKGKVVFKASDLITLIKMLLQKGEGLYMSHLSTILGERISGELNLYRELLKIMTEQDFCAESLRVVLKNPKHVTAILNLLNEMITESDDDEKDKVVGLSICLLKALNITSEQLDISGCYKEALEILDMVLTICEKLSSKSLIEEKDPNMLYARYQMGRIQRMMRNRIEEDKIPLYETARDTFKSIKNALKYEADETLFEINNLNSTEVPLFLLALANMAYIDSSLEEYEKSSQEFYTLYQQIIRFVLNIPINENLPEDFLNDETFSDIKESEKYQNLLTFTEESKRYLNILHVKYKIAYNSGLLSKKESSEGNYISAVRHLDNAIGIYKEVYHYRKKCFGLKDYTVVRAMRNLAIANKQILELWSGNKFQSMNFQLEYYKTALLCGYIYIQNNNKMYRCAKDIFWPCHRQVKYARNFIIQGMCNIASLYENTVLRTFDEKEKTRHQRKARNIYLRLYNTLLNGPHGPKHFSSSEEKFNAARICQQVGDFEREKMLRKELLNIQIKTLGKMNPFTRKTQERLEQLE